MNLDEMRAGDLTADQLLHLASCKRALENADPLPPLEYERRERTAEERCFAFAEWARELGISDAMIGSELYRKLLAYGYGSEYALQLLTDIGVDWKPLTEEERLVRIASEMLAAGWPESQVRWALNGLVKS